MSTSPDVCRSPSAPVPYPVWGKADDKENYSPDVRSNGCVIKRRDSRFTTTYGDEQGTGLGVKSNTVGSKVEPVTSSRIVRASGIPVQRRSEVLEAEWREFDLDAATWTIPRSRSKNDRAHVVPLSAQAVEILRGLPKIGQRPRLLFTTTGETAFSGVSKATERLQRLAASHLHDGEEVAPWRLHDLRRTFASGCARLGVPVHVVEKALNHTSGTHSGIVGVYQRHDYGEERRRAMELWAAHLDGLLSGGCKVVPLTRRSA